MHQIWEVIIDSQGRFISIGRIPYGPDIYEAVVLRYENLNQISNLDSLLDAEVGGENIELGASTGKYGSNTVNLSKGGVRIADMTTSLTADRDWSTVSADVSLSDGKSFVHNLTSTSGSASTYSLYVPRKSSDNIVGICPEATSLSQVTSSCPGLTQMTNRNSGFSEVSIGGVDFFKLDNMTGTGAYAYRDVSPNTIPAPDVCGQTAPSSAPDIYKADAVSGSSVLLHFTPPGEPYDSYVLEYGIHAGEYIYAADHMAGREETSYLVQNLSPGTNYFFRLRGGNGCAVGPWSNEVSAKTSGKTSNIFFNENGNPEFYNKPSEERLDTKITHEEKIKVENDDEKERVLKEGYIVSVEVVDKSNEPVSGARVEMHSEPMIAYTDNMGMATFNNVEMGKHTVKITYQGFEGSEEIDLNDDSVKQYDITVQIEKTYSKLTLFSALLFGVLLLIILFLVLKLRKKTPRD